MGYSLAVAGTLADSNQSDHDKESDKQSDLAVGDVGSLFSLISVPQAQDCAFLGLTVCQRPRIKPPSQEQSRDAKSSMLLDSMMAIVRRGEMRWWSVCGGSRVFISKARRPRRSYDYISLAKSARFTWNRMG